MSASSFSKTLEGLKDVAKTIERLSAHMETDLKSKVESLPDDKKEEVYKVVKESSDVINNDKMDLAQKLDAINKLKAKYGNSDPKK